MNFLDQFIKEKPPEIRKPFDEFTSRLSENKARLFFEEFGFNFKVEDRYIVRNLLEHEINNSSKNDEGEFLKVLCGYLFCIGNPEDVDLIKKVKNDLGRDVGLMINRGWTDAEMMKVDSMAKDVMYFGLREDYREFYQNYFNM